MIVVAALLMMAPASAGGGALPQQMHLPDTSVNASTPAKKKPPAQQAPSDTSTVSPVTVISGGKPAPADAEVHMQGSLDEPDQLVGIWPGGGAFNEGFTGHVRLRCMIDVHGLAERCEVADETPSGKGFAKAAMEMRATIKLAPAMGPDGPINSEKVISVTFTPPERRISGADVAHALATDYTLLKFNQQNGIELRKVTMLNSPIWVQAASFDDLAHAYPAGAQGQEGYAVDHCAVRKDGRLENCQIIKEDPGGKGFGNAALALSKHFRVDPQLASAPHRDELWVDLPIRFPSARELAERPVMAPTWVATFDPAKSVKLFPPEAVAQGLTTGRGVARCTVAADGSLSACTPEPGEPNGLGFSEAAAKLAGAMKMNLWAADALPVEGGVVHIPIRLNLKASPSPGP